MTRARRIAVGLSLAFVSLALLLELRVRAEPFPEALAKNPRASVRILDRSGHPLAEVTREGEHAGSIRLSELPRHVVDAVLAAEDARFHAHPGVDPLAMIRALGQAVLARRLVSGASTITQQLARTVVPRPRTLAGKWREMIVALRIERELDKDRILEAYLNHVEYGPRVRGLDAASRVYFDKPPSRLDQAEAALLVGLPRGPSFYDMRKKGLERARVRRDRILARLHDDDRLDDDAYERARNQPIRLQKARVFGGADHLARAIARGTLGPNDGGGPPREVVTTLDGRLQREVEGLVRATVERLDSADVSAAAVLVVDNETREVIAYVGAPDFWSLEALGQNDGTRARRQPGSALKPFVYAAAMASLGYTPATLLPDIELHLPTPRGDYSPRNYDGQFHGPVRLRQALASSLNVPAVYTAERVGPDRVLDVLRRFGFASLDRDASEYGAAIALGDGEVTLAELAAAYATLARGGEYRALEFTRSARLADGTTWSPPDRPTSSALARPFVRLITDVLADPNEREAGFGRNSVLELPFPVAVKTGTSKGYRDNWAIGYSTAITVAVWVGNFDGHPMIRSSGVTGAGPLFHDVMLAAGLDRHRRDTMRPRSDEAETESSLVADEFPSVEICPLSGALRGPHCPHGTRERFLPGTVPRDSCTFHERVAIVPSSGWRAGPACTDATLRVFERYPATYSAWAEKALRPTAPRRFDPRCPGELTVESRVPRLVYPVRGARFSIDPSLPRDQQRLVFRAEGATDEPLHFVLNGARLAPSRPPAEHAWPIVPGHHRLHVESSAGASPAVEFDVE